MSLKARIMKKIILTILCAFVYTAVGFAKPSTDENSLDTIAFMQNMVKLGNESKGEKVSVIIDNIRGAKIPIKVLDYDYTSPFLDSEGKCFLRCIVISYKDVTPRNWPLLRIYINETNCEADHFEDDMHAYDGNGEERANRIKDLFTIKKAEFKFIPVDYSKEK